MKRGGFVYIMSNKYRTTLYCGVTADLIRRVQEHRSGVNPDSFTARYRLFDLVYFECLPTIDEAILREKQIKAGSRAKKDELVRSINPEWSDLYQKAVEQLW